MTKQHRVILDTDIGTDVDDAMALALILGSEEIRLEGVTTVYGDTRLRAQLAQRYAGLANRSIDVFQGASETLSGREVWWPGHEGTLHDDLDKEIIHGDLSAVDYLRQTVRQHPEQIDVVGIGPLTNIAESLVGDPQFASGIRHLWIMGGAFSLADIEHNFRSDAAAAEIVFRSQIPTTVVALDVTEKIRIEDSQLKQIEASGPLGQALLADIKQWWEFWETEWNVPHDPVTVLAMTNPELFTFSAPGYVTIDQSAETFGKSVFVEHPEGNARIVTDLDAIAVTEEIVSRIVRADTHVFES